MDKKLQDHVFRVQAREGVGAGGGQVVRNDSRPEVVGFEKLRDLRPTAGDGRQWSGEVYAAQLGEYKDASLTPKGNDLLRCKVKVGFLRLGRTGSLRPGK